MRISSWLVISFLMLSSLVLSERCEAKSSAFGTSSAYGSNPSTSTFSGGGHQGLRGARNGAFDLQNSGFNKFRQSFVNRRFKEHPFDAGGLNSEFGKNVVSAKVSRVSGEAEASNRKAIHKEADAAAAAKAKIIKPFDLSSETLFNKNQAKSARVSSGQVFGPNSIELNMLRGNSFTEHAKSSKSSKFGADNNKDKQDGGNALAKNSGPKKRGFGEFRNTTLFERSFQRNAQRRATTSSSFGAGESEDSFGTKNRENNSSF